jgi:xylulokinase
MGVTLGAGLSLRWFRDQLAPLEVAVGHMASIDPYVLIARQAADAPAGCEGLVWLPYVMGERTPHLDPNATGVLFGVTGRHSRAHVVRAIMEGVAYSLRDSLEILRGLGVPLGEVRFSGGGARSPLWRQIQSDVFGLAGMTLNVEEGPAFGVALLAGVGTGVYATVEEACAATLRLSTQVEPDSVAVRTYNAHYEVYRRLYPALKPVYEQSAAIAASQ